jgi:Excreted virulence factor EspC, type VII ESX diderm
MSDDPFLLDYDDMYFGSPGGKLPYGYTELIPGSGIGIPNLATNELHPGFWQPHPPKHPVDLDSFVYRKPGELGLYGYRELGAGSGVWIPNPYGTYYPSDDEPSAKRPIDVASIKSFPPGQVPYGYQELVPGSGVAVPAPKGYRPDQPGDPADPNTHPAGADGKPFHVEYAILDRNADSHDTNAEQVQNWAAADPNFAQRFIDTHGKVAYGTYLNVARYIDSRQTQGAAFAERNASTAASLRNAIQATSSTDEANAARFAPPPTSV